jgi:hypothetical protein
MISSTLPYSFKRLLRIEFDRQYIQTLFESLRISYGIVIEELPDQSLSALILRTHNHHPPLHPALYPMGPKVANRRLVYLAVYPLVYIQSNGISAGMNIPGILALSLFLNYSKVGPCRYIH